MSQPIILVKQEEVSIVSVVKVLQSLQLQVESIKQGLRLGGGGYSGGSGRGAGSRSCVFYSESRHFICSCSKVLEYITNKRCAQSLDNKIVMTNSSTIIKIGQTLKEKVDSYFLLL